MDLIMNLSNTTRLKAFLIHLSISSLIFLILLYFILVYWYPQPLFSTDGGWKIVRIIAGIHLVLGPLLTLIIFKSGKPGLKFDLSVIALLQALALTWGVFMITNEHPAAIIYTFDHFTPVSANQLKNVGMTTDKLKKYGTERPILIFNNIPKEKEYETLAESIKTGKPLYLFSEYYTKFSKEHAKTLQEKTIRLDKYVEDKPELKKRYQHSLLRNATKINTIYIALHSREKWVTTIFDLDSMRIIDIIDIDPVAYSEAQKTKGKSRNEK